VVAAHHSGTHHTNAQGAFALRRHVIHWRIGPD